MIRDGARLLLQIVRKQCLDGNAEQSGNFRQKQNIGKAYVVFLFGNNLIRDKQQLGHLKLCKIILQSEMLDVSADVPPDVTLHKRFAWS